MLYFPPQSVVSTLRLFWTYRDVTVTCPWRRWAPWPFCSCVSQPCHYSFLFFVECQFDCALSRDSLADLVIRHHLLRLAVPLYYKMLLKQQKKSRVREAKEQKKANIDKSCLEEDPDTLFLGSLCATNSAVDYIACQLSRSGLLPRRIAFTLDGANKGTFCLQPPDCYQETGVTFQWR